MWVPYWFISELQSVASLGAAQAIRIKLSQTKLGVLAQDCDPGTGEAETGGPSRF